MKRSLIISLLICAVLLTACGKSEAVPASDSNAQSEAAEVIESCTAVIEIENYGSITLQLDGNAAPITVANFVSLAESGYM